MNLKGYYIIKNGEKLYFNKRYEYNWLDDEYIYEFKNEKYLYVICLKRDEDLFEVEKMHRCGLFDLIGRWKVRNVEHDILYNKMKRYVGRLWKKNGKIYNIKYK